jgi:uncharacterized protein YkwD
MSIAAALFVAACAAVPAATGDEVSVLGAEIGGVAAPESTVDPFDLDPALMRRAVDRSTTSTTTSAPADDAPADDEPTDEPSTDELPGDPAATAPTGAEMALAALPPVDTAPTTTTAAPAPAPAPAPGPAPTTTVAPPPPTTAPPPPPTVPPTTTAPPPPAAPTADSGARSSFVGEINALRASVGVGGLARSGDLDARAQAWADVMARDDWLRHSTVLGTLVAGSWSTAGENVGYGPSVGSIFGGLRGSSGHYANMVNGAFTHVGVGVVVIDGVMWTAHLFAG